VTKSLGPVSDVYRLGRCGCCDVDYSWVLRVMVNGYSVMGDLLLTPGVNLATMVEYFG